MSEVIEYIRQVCLEHDRLYPGGEDPFERRRRELAEIAKREQARAPKLDTSPQFDWSALDARIRQHIEAHNEIFREAVGDALGKHTRKVADGLEKRLRTEIAELRDELKAATSKLNERLARLPLVKAWEPDAVHYIGDVVTHDGGVGRTNEKRYSRMRTRSDGFRRLKGARASPQLPQLSNKKSGHSRRAERSYFIEHRREFWLLD